MEQKDSFYVYILFFCPVDKADILEGGFHSRGKLFV